MNGKAQGKIQISLDDELVKELLDLTEKNDPDVAVTKAVREFLIHAKGEIGTGSPR